MWEAFDKIVEIADQHPKPIILTLIGFILVGIVGGYSWVIVNNERIRLAEEKANSAERKYEEFVKLKTREIKEIKAKLEELSRKINSNGKSATLENEVNDLEQVADAFILSSTGQSDGGLKILGNQHSDKGIKHVRKIPQPNSKDEPISKPLNNTNSTHSSFISKLDAYTPHLIVCGVLLVIWIIIRVKR